MESSVILVRCPQMMLLKQCIRRAVQEGLIHPSGHAFFFPHFQFSPLSAMPALLTCPAASEVAAPGGPSIDVGEVIRQNLERTRAQDGLSAVWINNYYYQDWRHSCVQDVAAMEMISPSSSASEMEPVKDPNQCWLILWKRVRSV